MRRKKYDAPCVQEYHLMEESDLLAGTGGLQPPRIEARRIRRKLRRWI